MHTYIFVYLHSVMYLYKYNTLPSYNIQMLYFLSDVNSYQNQILGSPLELKGGSEFSVVLFYQFFHCSVHFPLANASFTIHVYENKIFQPIMSQKVLLTWFWRSWPQPIFYFLRCTIAQNLCQNHAQKQEYDVNKR